MLASLYPNKLQFNHYTTFEEEIPGIIEERNSVDKAMKNIFSLNYRFQREGVKCGPDQRLE